MFKILVPGTGLLHLEKREYFWAQNIKISPKSENMLKIGCRDMKKQVKRNKFIK